MPATFEAIEMVVTTLMAAVAQSIEPPELSSPKEVQRSDVTLIPGCSLR